ncbi:MAG: hypothetical protein GXO37_01585 [Chloroflexi bacterium]|nr:hypothetical protein [Chloroflexota bacterium]
MSTSPSPSPRRPRAAGLLLFALLSALGALLVLDAGWSVSFWNRIYPGVHVAAVDLSGLTVEQAVARLRTAYPYPEQAGLTLVYQGQTWTVRPAEIGFAIDAVGTAQDAWSIGRTGPWWSRHATRVRAWRQGVEVPLRTVFSEPWASAFLQTQVAPAVERPVQEARVWLEGTQVHSQPGQAGRRLDYDATLAALAAHLARFSPGPVPITVREIPPRIADPEPVAARLRAVLAQPVTLTLPPEDRQPAGPWSFPPEQVAASLQVVPGTDAAGQPALHIRVDPDAWRPVLEDLAQQLAQDPVNARFTFDDATRELVLLQPAVWGRRLDVEASLDALQTALAQGLSQVQLVVDYTPPPVTDDARAADLGITEQVAEHTTYFYGSSPERIHNIQVAGSRFHGYLVAPGEVFSMAEVLGDVSLDNGYAESLIIYGDRTIRGVGGGVCQVSTTLFRTVFFGGYPVVERHPHAYRVLYYEQTASGRLDPRLAGLDATVYVPLVDFKFKNDTPYWILMEVEVNPAGRYITWRFYSTSDGRTVVWDTTGLQDKEEPPEPLYVENPALAKGEIKQVDWAVEGARVTVLREVFRDGTLLYRDEFTTHYRPWRAVCEYGPGTPGMPPAEPDPRHPCRPDQGEE